MTSILTNALHAGINQFGGSALFGNIAEKGASYFQAENKPDLIAFFKENFFNPSAEKLHNAAMTANALDVDTAKNWAWSHLEANHESIVLATGLVAGATVVNMIIRHTLGLRAFPSLLEGATSIAAATAIYVAVSEQGLEIEPNFDAIANVFATQALFFGLCAAAKKVANVATCGLCSKKEAPAADPEIKEGHEGKKAQ